MKIDYQCLSFQDLTLDQLYAIMVLRQEVFVVEQHCVYLDADGKDQEAYHLMGCDDQGRLASYVRILPPGIAHEEYAAISRVLTAAYARGKGLGRPLMQTAIEQIYLLYGKIRPIKLSAQAHLQDYYLSLGFRSIGELYLEDGIPHISMVRENEKGYK